MEGNLTSVLNHKVDTLDAEHVGNLMRIGNGSNRAVLDGNMSKVLWKQHAALNVNVAVDEAWQDKGGVIIKLMIEEGGWQIIFGRKNGSDAPVVDNKCAVVNPLSQRINDMSCYLKGIVH